MADGIISIVIEQISNLLRHEIGFVSGVREDVERLQAELKRMQCFLKDADCKQDRDERVRNWIAEIRELAYDADDVVDIFLLKIVDRQVEMVKCVNKFTPNKFRHLHKIGTKIKSINAKLADISNSLQTYGIKFINEGEGSSSANEMQQRLRRTDPDDDEEAIISLESTTNDVLAQLMKEEDQLRIVSIVGMGGLGKTTLAKKVYNHIDVKQRFDCCSWAFISQQFSPLIVLSGILKEVDRSADVEKLTEVEVVKKLKHALKEKQYLVVLDDIWKEEAWDSLKQAFPKGKKGSKVIFTTRIKDVALYADPWSSPVEPPFLTDEQGWQLLRKKAFREDFISNHQYMAEFERLGKAMVIKCEGLPLAIAVLGGLLANKSMGEWEVVHRDINAQFIKLQQRSPYAGVNWILALSYHDLPFRLKPCFLYFSQFPEDYEIRRKRLIRMWIAEGFIPQPQKGEGDDDMTMENVGEEFFEELVNRCMVQRSQWEDQRFVRGSTCRMHDLMRDMCLLKAKEENFLAVVEHDQDQKKSATASSNFSPQTRRIAIHCRQHSFAEECCPRLRSLVYVVLYADQMEKHHVKFIFKNFKLLRVLKLQNLKPKYIPRNFGDLIQLRYLELNAYLDMESCCICPAFRLPASIGNLRSLYTLDLTVTESTEIPDSTIIPDVLWKLKCLRHLFLRGVIGNFRLDTLTNLETLKWVEAKNLITNDAMLKLTNLRNLAILFYETKDAELVLPSISGLGLGRRLCSLKIFISSRRREVPWELLSLSGCFHLTKLEIEGPILQLAPYHDQLLPQSLTKLTLVGSGLRQDPMGILGKLPKLRYLSLKYDGFHPAYEGSKMVCSCFQQLEFLELSKLQEEWEIEEGAMLRLKKLYIMDLNNLKAIPQGLKFISTLRTLVLYDNRKDFRRRVQVIDGVEGEDFDKVRHIPFVTVES